MEKSYRVSRAKATDLPDPVASAFLDNEIGARIGPLTHQVALRQWRNGRKIHVGPYRPSTRATALVMAHTIVTRGRIGDKFIIRLRWRPVVRVDVLKMYRGDRVIARAKSELGTMYRFGVANGPEDPGKDAFDCSGLTMWAWDPYEELPHSAEAQRTAFNIFNFDNENDCMPGDLIFMNFPNSRGIQWPHASHVGLHLGYGRTGMMLDTRNPISEPVGIRPIDHSHVVGYGRPN